MTSMSDSGSIPQRYRYLLVSAILLALCLAIYWQAGSFSFINLDDDVLVTGNHHVLSGLTPQSLSWAFSWKSGTDYFWYPLTWLSHMTDVSLFDLDAGKHHLVSAAIHSLNAIILFLVLLRMTGAMWRSAFVAALFAAHPLHVESVAWVAERKDVLSAFFYLLALLAYTRYAERPGVGRYVTVASLFGLALMSKPMVVTLPLALLLLDGWPLRRISGFSAGDEARFRKVSLKRVLLEKVPLLMMAAGMAAVTMMKSTPPPPLDQFPLSQRVAHAFIAYATYLWKMVCPTSLAVFYPYEAGLSHGVPTLKSLASALILIAVTVLALRQWRRRSYLAAGWLFFLVSLVPVIGIVEGGTPPMADRFTYIPSIGIFIAAAWLIPDSVFPRRIGGKVVFGAAVVVVVLYTLTARVQAGYWRDSGRLFEHALAVTTNNAAAHNSLGVHLSSQGRYEEGISHLREAIRIDPASARARYNLALAHNNFGIRLFSQGRNEEGISHLREAIRLSPNWEMYCNLGAELARKGAVDEAMFHYREAIRLNANVPETHNNLGALLARQGNFPDAIFHFREALRLRPDYPMARENLARACDAVDPGLRRPRRSP